MKYFFVILALLAVAVYSAFFYVSTEVFRDTGSFKEKVVTLKFGVKTIELKENDISKFLSKEGVKEPESWIRTKSWLNGFIDYDVFYKEYKYKNEFLIEQLEGWLLERLNTKKEDIKYKETVIKPTLLKFKESLRKDDYQGLINVLNSLDID